MKGPVFLAKLYGLRPVSLPGLWSGAFPTVGHLRAFRGYLPSSAGVFLKSLSLGIFRVHFDIIPPPLALCTRSKNKMCVSD